MEIFIYLYISYCIFTVVHGNVRVPLQLATLKEISMHLIVCAAEYIDTTAL